MWPAMPLVMAAALAAAAPGAAQEPSPPAAAPEVAIGIGVSQIEHGDFEGAVKTLEPAIARLRGDPARVRLLVQADIQLAVAQVALDQEAGAVQAFSEALSLSPDLRLPAEQYSPKVLRAFEAAREQRARRTGTAAARRSPHKTGLLIGGAVVLGGGAAAIVATRGSSGPTFSGARFATPVLECPNGSDNVHLPFAILVEASNPSGTPVPITSASTVVEIVNGTVASEFGFKSNLPTTVVPASLPSKQAVTLRLDSYLICGNGFGDPPRFNEWSGRLTLTTAAGVFMLDVADHMSVNIP
jgi:hypothetical protein